MVIKSSAQLEFVHLHGLSWHLFRHNCTRKHKEASQKHCVSSSLNGITWNCY